MTVRMLDLDLSRPLPSVWGMERFPQLNILVRYQEEVLGWVALGNAGLQPVLSAPELRQVLVKESAWPLSQAILRQKLATAPSLGAMPSISVVVSSQQRPVQLSACLSAIQATGYPCYEVIVVDCAPANDEVIRVAERFGATYVRGDFRGTDAARNQGATIARHDIVAFTSDRSQPDRFWLRQLGMMFHDPDVQAVTGLVAPVEPDSTVWLSDEFVLWNEYKMRPALYRKSELGVAERLSPRQIGSGCNMALRRNLLSLMGRFDVGLSADSAGEGSGDVDFLHRLLCRGYAVHYQPNAIVWLTHQQGDQALRRRSYERGRYAGAHLLACVRNRTESKATIVKYFLRTLIYRRILKRLIKPAGVSRRLTLQELRGLLSSPHAYWKGRAFARRFAGSGIPLVAAADAAPIGNAPITYATPQPTVPYSAPLPGATTIRVIRTWYPHWGAYAGINQYLKHLDRRKFHVSELLVPENDNDFPIGNAVVSDWLRHRVKRHGMAWYNLSDLAAEFRTVSDYLLPSGAALLHYLDGEHSAQFVPRRFRIRNRPATIVTYHQPPDVLMRVVRIDVARAFDCITVVAPEQEEFFRSQIGSTPVRLILHGIDCNYYRPASNVQPSSTVKCITVGHNYRDYQAVKEVAERLRSVRQLEFHVVSPRATGVEHLPNVRSYQGVTDEELLLLYQRADILFLPLTKATANNSLLEGMACGLPVVSTGLPAIRAYTNPSAAILIDNNDPKQLAEALVHLVENAPVRQIMAMEARKKAEELDWPNIAPAFESLYAEFIPR